MSQQIEQGASGKPDRAASLTASAATASSQSGIPSAKHQPGPWAASEMRMTAKDWASLNGDHDLTVVLTNGDGFHGDVVAAVWCDDDHSELDTARLIAAAPDMLAALVDLVESFEKHRPKAYWDAARAAIAKATGGAA